MSGYPRAVIHAIALGVVAARQPTSSKLASCTAANPQDSNVEQCNPWCKADAEHKIHCTVRRRTQSISTPRLPHCCACPCLAVLQMQGLYSLRRHSTDAAQTAAASSSAAILRLDAGGRLKLCHVRALVYSRVCNRALQPLQMPELPILRAESSPKTVATAAATLTSAAPIASTTAILAATLAWVRGLQNPTRRWIGRNLEHLCVGWSRGSRQASELSDERRGTAGRGNQHGGDRRIGACHPRCRRCWLVCVAIVHPSGRHAPTARRRLGGQEVFRGLGRHAMRRVCRCAA